MASLFKPVRVAHCTVPVLDGCLLCVLLLGCQGGLDVPTGPDHVRTTGGSEGHAADGGDGVRHRQRLRRAGEGGGSMHHSLGMTGTCACHATCTNHAWCHSRLLSIHYSCPDMGLW